MSVEDIITSLSGVHADWKTIRPRNDGECLTALRLITNDNFHSFARVQPYGAHDNTVYVVLEASLEQSRMDLAMPPAGRRDHIRVMMDMINQDDRWSETGETFELKRDALLSISSGVACSQVASFEAARKIDRMLNTRSAVLKSLTLLAHQVIDHDLPYREAHNALIQINEFVHSPMPAMH